MRDWYNWVFHLYLCGVVMYYVIFGISFPLANAAGQHVASPIAKRLVVGIGILSLAGLHIVSLLRTAWEAFRCLTLNLLVSHVATCVACDVALSLTADFSLLNAVVRSFLSFSHLSNIIAAYHDSISFALTPIFTAFPHPATAARQRPATHRRVGGER
jgi:hypothetical protein